LTVTRKTINQPDPRSDLSRFVTGSDRVVDGGMTMP
jgi:hypothetical protein